MSILVFFSECVAKGSCFCLGGSGGGAVFVPISELWPRAFASVRERRARSFCARCAVPLGLASREVGEALWRCAVVIGGESVVWVALCRCDWRGERGLGGVVPL